MALKEQDSHMTNLFKLGFGQISAFIGKLEQSGFTAEMAKAVIKRPALATTIVEVLKRELSTKAPQEAPKPEAKAEENELIHGLFTPTDRQLARMREWNQQCGWGISDEAFAEAEKSIPAWPADRLVAVVLVPNFADKANEDETITSGLERTFHELWMRAKAEQDANWRMDGYDKASSDRLRLHKGIEHKVGLRWEVIDLGCNRGKKPMDVRNSKSSPSAGVLAAAALHPQWVKSMDGDKVPYVWIPGYEVNIVSGEDPWQSMPSLGFDRGSRELGLYCSWHGSCGSDWSVPVLVRE